MPGLCSKASWSKSIPASAAGVKVLRVFVEGTIRHAVVFPEQQSVDQVLTYHDLAGTGL